MHLFTCLPDINYLKVITIEADFHCRYVLQITMNNCMHKQHPCSKFKKDALAISAQSVMGIPNLVSMPTDLLG